MSDCQELYELNKKEQRQQQLSASLESNRSSRSSGAKTLDGGEVLFHTCLSPGGGALQRPPCVGKARWGLGITEAARTQGAKMLKKKKKEMWRFEVDTAHVILVLGICQFLSYMWDGGREPSRKMLL